MDGVLLGSLGLSPRQAKIAKLAKARKVAARGPASLALRPRPPNRVEGRQPVSPGTVRPHAPRPMPHTARGHRMQCEDIDLLPLGPRPLQARAQRLVEVLGEGLHPPLPGVEAGGHAPAERAAAGDTPRRPRALGPVLRLRKREPPEVDGNQRPVVSVMHLRRWLPDTSFVVQALISELRIAKPKAHPTFPTGAGHIPLSAQQALGYYVGTWELVGWGEGLAFVPSSMKKGMRCGMVVMPVPRLAAGDADVPAAVLTAHLAFSTALHAVLLSALSREKGIPSSWGNRIRARCERTVLAPGSLHTRRCEDLLTELRREVDRDYRRAALEFQIMEYIRAHEDTRQGLAAAMGLSSGLQPSGTTWQAADLPDELTACFQQFRGICGRVQRALCFWEPAALGALLEVEGSLCPVATDMDLACDVLGRRLRECSTREAGPATLEQLQGAQHAHQVAWRTRICEQWPKAVAHSVKEHCAMSSTFNLYATHPGTYDDSHLSRLLRLIRFRMRAQLERLVTDASTNAVDLVARLARLDALGTTGDTAAAEGSQPAPRGEELALRAPLVLCEAFVDEATMDVGCSPPLDAVRDTVVSVLDVVSDMQGVPDVEPLVVPLLGMASRPLCDGRLNDALKTLNDESRKRLGAVVDRALAGPTALIAKLQTLATIIHSKHLEPDSDLTTPEVAEEIDWDVGRLRRAGSSSPTGKPVRSRRVASSARSAQRQADHSRFAAEMAAEISRRELVTVDFRAMDEEEAGDLIGWESCSAEEDEADSLGEFHPAPPSRAEKAPAAEEAPFRTLVPLVLDMSDHEDLSLGTAWAEALLANAKRWVALARSVEEDFAAVERYAVVELRCSAAVETLSASARALAESSVETVASKALALAHAAHAEFDMILHRLGEAPGDVDGRLTLLEVERSLDDRMKPALEALAQASHMCDAVFEAGWCKEAMLAAVVAARALPAQVAAARKSSGLTAPQRRHDLVDLLHDEQEGLVAAWQGIWESVRADIQAEWLVAFVPQSELVEVPLTGAVRQTLVRMADERTTSAAEMLAQFTALTQATRRLQGREKRAAAVQALGEDREAPCTADILARIKGAQRLVLLLRDWWEALSRVAKSEGMWLEQRMAELNVAGVRAACFDWNDACDKLILGTREDEAPGVVRLARWAQRSIMVQLAAILDHVAVFQGARTEHSASGPVEDVDSLGCDAGSSVHEVVLAFAAARELAPAVAEADRDHWPLAS